MNRQLLMLIIEMKKISLLGLLLVFAGYHSAVMADSCDTASLIYLEAKKEQNAQVRLIMLEQSTELCTSFKAYYLEAQTWHALQQYNKAIGAYEKALLESTTAKTSALVMARTAELMIAKGDDFAALGLLRAALDKDPQAPAWIRTLFARIDTKYASRVVTSSQISRALNPPERSFGVTGGINLRINFALNSDQLDRNGRAQMQQLGNALKAMTGSFTLIGHTDKQGDKVYNQSLSIRRSTSVKRALESQFSVLRGKLCTQGEGEANLLYEGDNEAVHKLNRRVEIKLGC